MLNVTRRRDAAAPYTYVEATLRNIITRALLITSQLITYIDRSHTTPQGRLPPKLRHNIWRKQHDTFLVKNTNLQFTLDGGRRPFSP